MPLMPSNQVVRLGSVLDLPCLEMFRYPYLYYQHCRWYQKFAINKKELAVTADQLKAWASRTREGRSSLVSSPFQRNAADDSNG